MAKALSVIIPCRNEFKNLLWTLQGIQAEAHLGACDLEIIVVLNKCDDADHERLSKSWPVRAGWVKVVRYDEKSSCWQARNAGASIAEGEYLAFLDSHVMFRPGSLQAGLNYCQAMHPELVPWLPYHPEFKGILAFAMNYWLDHPARTLYQYKWQPHKFWGSWSRQKPEAPDYRILMSGMNLMIDRDVFEEIGGFHPALGIYGGGEPYIYFKTQMFGYEARCVPEVQLYHLAEKRGYAWTNDDLWRNFMIAAYAIGGEAALAPLYANYEQCCKGVKRYLYRLDQLRDEAVNLAEADRLWTRQNAKKTFQEVLDDRREE